MENHTQSEDNKSDNEETFEDAPDTTPRPVLRRVRSGSPASVRSLTGRRTSQSSVKAAEKLRQSTGTPVVPEDDEDGETNGVENNSPQTNGTPEANDVKNPPLSAKSTSDGEMDDVSLAEDSSQAPSHSRSSTLTSVHSPPPGPKLPPRDSTSSMQGLSGTLQNTFPPPPPPPKPDAVPEKAKPPARKLASPFSWLSRNTSGEKKTTPSPPPQPASHQRRGTNASNITINSTITEEGHEDARASLKDRFTMLRMQEESGIRPDDNDATSPAKGGALAGLVGRSASIGGLGISSPTSGVDEKEEPKSPELKSPVLSRQPTINPKLPPGTAAGMSASQSDAPVDWELWQQVVYEGPAAVARTSAEELKNAIASGIPQAIRGVVWQVIADSSNEELQALYRDLVARGTEVNGVGKEKEHVKSSASSVHSAQSTPAIGSDTQGASMQRSTSEIGVNGNAPHAEDFVGTMIFEAKHKPHIDNAAIQKLEKTIRRDLGARTSYSKYVMAAGLQDGLFGICKAYALLDEQVGYAQGMNFIAMPLLFNMTEEEAFSLMTTLMTHPKYHLRSLFTAEMPGLHLLLYQFARALEDADPQLYCHLHRRGVEPRLYATQWFLTLFAYRFPLQLVLRVYDFVLSEGLEAAMIRFAISLVSKNRLKLLEMRDMSALSTFLKEKLFDVYIDKSPSASSILESGFFGMAGGADKEVYKADELVSDAVAVAVSPEMLRSYEAEWTEQMRIEKAREVELESLKSSVTTLTAKVRRLEEAAERSDKEHVSIATDVVRTKVENETLRDENETYKGQVEELRKVVAGQTEEVESRLRGEMESVMQKNAEIFGANRRLEEELADMEKVLISVKLEHAQLNSEHESLKRKWNAVAGMMQPQ